MNKRESHIAGLIAERIKKQDPDAEVILFGSHASGRAGKDSDWDILILINKPKRNRDIEKAYRDVIFQLELDLAEPISTLILSKSDWESKHANTPLYQSIKKEGVLIS